MNFYIVKSINEIRKGDNNVESEDELLESL